MRYMLLIGYDETFRRALVLAPTDPERRFLAARLAALPSPG